MSDQGIVVSAEDRERLAKTKFGEWFDEFFEKKFEEAFEKKQMTRRPSPPAPPQQQPPAWQNADAGEPAPHRATPVRRRSLLEACLTDTFGF
jgi:hypothetical protein